MPVFKSLKLKAKGLRLIFNCKRVNFNDFIPSGFTLIELLIVITIFALTVAMITASFTTFEKNSRIKNASETLKSDLRYLQNLALTGSRGTNSLCGLAAGASPAPSTYTLVGWYINVNPGTPSSYTYGGNCQISGASTQTTFETKTVTLPKNVVISSVNSGNNSLNILFRPLASNITVHTASNTPPFLNTSGAALNLFASQGPIVIRLTSTDTSDIYDVTIDKSGNIYETKI